MESVKVAVDFALAWQFGFSVKAKKRGWKVVIRDSNGNKLVLHIPLSGDIDLRYMGVWHAVETDRLQAQLNELLW